MSPWMLYAAAAVCMFAIGLLSVVDGETHPVRKILAVNVKGPLEVCRRAYPVMKARGGGAIVNVSSIGGISPEPGLGLYSVSKAALVSLTKVLAQEWGADGIRANVICPGLIQTKFSQALWEDERILKHMMSQQPIKRVGQPDDVAGLALFLASDAATYCTSVSERQTHAFAASMMSPAARGLIPYWMRRAAASMSAREPSGLTSPPNDRFDARNRFVTCVSTAGSGAIDRMTSEIS